MRLAHVDIARGLCILLVVVGHNPTLSPEGSLFNQILGTFRMPLLFFVAGTFFRSDTPLRELALTKADALLKPFVVMALLQAPFRFALWDADPVSYALSVLAGSGNYAPWFYALWFLPHLWLLFLFSWCIARVSRRFQLKVPELVMLMGTLLMLGVQMLPVFWQLPVEVMGMAFLVKGLPFSADLLPISCFFFLLGMLTRNAFHRLQFRWPALLLSATVLAWTMLLYQPQVSLYDRSYSHIFASTAAALAGCTIVIEVSAAIVRLPRLSAWLAYCGFNSLFILLFHSPLQSAARRVLEESWGENSLPAGVGAYVSSIAASLMLAHVIRQRPWLGVLFLPLKQVRKTADDARYGRTAAAPAVMASAAAGDPGDLDSESPPIARRA